MSYLHILFITACQMDFIRLFFQAGSKWIQRLFNKGITNIFGKDIYLVLKNTSYRRRKVRCEYCVHLDQITTICEDHTEKHNSFSWRDFIWSEPVSRLLCWTQWVDDTCLLFILQVQQTVWLQPAVRLLWCGWGEWASWWSLSGSTSGCAMWPKWCRCRSHIHLHPFLCTCPLDEANTASMY